MLAIVLLVVLALFTVTPGAAVPELPLASRLHKHVAAIGSSERNAATPARLEDAARYIERVLATEGYAIRRQDYRAGDRKVRNIEVSVSNLAPGAKPARIFIVGAHYDSAPGAPGANDNGSGTAAVLELARLLKDIRPSQGTEVKFVFFVNEEGDGLQLPPGLAGRYPDAGRPDAGRPDAGNFIAFVGTMASARLVQDALSAFRAASDFPAHGLAAPAYVQGVTLSDHSSYQRFGYPAIMITDTAFLRYPYYDTAEDTPDKLDYDSTARVVQGLARTITALASGAQG